jgi:hypothetical protein
MFSPPYMYNNDIIKNQINELLLLLDIENKNEKESHIYNRTIKSNVIDKHLRYFII